MKRLTGHLYFWVLLAILAGGTFGFLDATNAVKLKPLGDGFISLVKMLISPVIFCTVVLGIAGAGDMKKWVAWVARHCCILKWCPPWR